MNITNCQHSLETVTAIELKICSNCLATEIEINQAEKLEKAEKALRVYADEENWCDNCYYWNYNYSAEKLQCYNSELCRDLDKWIPNYEQLKSKLEKAEKALVFYSIPANYGYNRDCDAHVEWIDDKTHQRMGRKAQQALKEIRGEG